jgi:hypothetical protein
MEPEVQKAQAVARSELDTAFDERRGRRRMVVQSMPTTPWGYELWSVDRPELWPGVPVVVELPEDR